MFLVFNSTPMRGVFFGVEATLYSFTLPQRFWQVTRDRAFSTVIPTEARWLVRASVLFLIVQAIALFILAVFFAISNCYL